MKKLTTELFIKKSREIHGDRYNYGTVNYINARTKVQIICKDHGVFNQVPNSHLLGTGCPNCAGVSRSNIDLFIEKAKAVHGDRYDYSLSAYINNRSMVDIICKEHGTFQQKALSHIKGFGCYKCGRVSTGTQNRVQGDIFVSKAKEIHGDKYDYSLVEYKTNSTKVKIICKKHGIFEQIPGNHIYLGTNCPRCSMQYGKWEEQMIEKLGVWKPGIVIEECIHPDWLNGMELDIYLPEFKLAIEYNGHKFHHSSHGQFVPAKPRNYHSNKFSLCKENGVTLISIFDFLYNDKWDELIKHRIGCSKRIYARNTAVFELVDKKFYYDFCDANHIEGIGPRLSDAKIYGLRHDGEIVMVMSAGKYTVPGNDPIYKIIRSCTLKGFQVVGGISKLHKQFPEAKFELTNNTGAKLGKFVKGSERYWWVKGVGEHRSRLQCQKYRIKKDFPEAVGNTETELMESMGFVRVFDAGLSTL